MKIKFVFAEDYPALEEAVNTLLENASAVSSVNVFKQDAFYVAAVAYTEAEAAAAASEE